MKNERFYSWKLISYAPLEHIITVCKNICNHFAIIFHDKDINEDGTPKEPHHHIICTTKQPKSFNSIRKAFEEGTDQNTLAKTIDDMQEDYEYLTHKNNPDKYQYSSADIIEDDSNYWIKISKDEQQAKASNEEFINDLIEKSYVEMAIKYGRDYMKNFDKYEKFKLIIIGRVK